MTIRSSALAIAVACLMGSGSALAQSCHTGAFSGPYLGVMVGGVGTDSEQSPRSRPKLSGTDHSGSFGGFLGYGLQCGRFVIGAEADIAYAETTIETELPDPSFLKSSVNGLATVRGRIGVTVHDHAMIYATAGVGFADRTHWVLDPTAPGGTFTQTDSDITTGWVVGGGVEFLNIGRFSLRAEALWVDLGSEKRTYVVSTTGCGGGVCDTVVDWDDTLWTARLGVSMKLSRDEPVYHEPLK